MPFGLYKHLRSLGIQVDKTHGHPLQKVCTVKWSFWSGHSAKSLGLIQITGNNIAYINVIEDCYGGYRFTSTSYYLEYLVPISEIASSLCRAILSSKKRGLLRRKVVDIEWHGGTLVDRLNDDSTLNQDLLTAFQLDRPIGITVTPEPTYQCIRIETDLHLPSRSLFDCLDRIAGHAVQHVTELNSRPEKEIFKSEVKMVSGLKHAGLINCRVTDREVVLESTEPLRIPWYQVDECSYQLASYPEQVSPTEAGQGARNSITTIRYHDKSGRGRKVEFEMNTMDAWTLKDAISRSYPLGIRR